MYKEGSRNDMDNYRPISVLSVAFKILEKEVKKNNLLISVLGENKLLSNYLCGVHRNYSTQSAITFLADLIRNDIDKGFIKEDLFIDFRKAFNTTDHVNLLEKLELNENEAGDKMDVYFFHQGQPSTILCVVIV